MIQALRRTIETSFPELWEPTEAVLATCLALCIEDMVNPPTCILTGPASTGKTTVLDFLGAGDQDDPLVYRSDKFSPAAFVSHSSNVKREKLGETDLLPRIKGRILVTPELGPTFRGREEMLTESFATLTAVLDGHGLISDSGTHGRRGYVGAEYVFAWLGATTPLPPTTWRVMAQLGSRLLFYAMPEVDVDNTSLVEALHGSTYRRKIAECRSAVRTVLEARWQDSQGVRGVPWERSVPGAIEERLMALARLVPKIRGIVTVWRDREGQDLDYTPPNIEAPYRALSCLHNLARGRALLYGRRHLLPEDLDLVARLAVSSGPYDRSRLLQALLDAGGQIRTTEAAMALRATPPTAGKVMKALEVLELADMTGEGNHQEGKILTLRPEWRAAMGLDPWIDTGAFSFQPGSSPTQEVESEASLCASTPAGEVDPWAS